MEKQINKISIFLMISLIIRLILIILDLTFNIYITGFLYYIIYLIPIVLLFIFNKKIDNLDNYENINKYINKNSILIWLTFIISLLTFNELYIILFLIETCMMISTEQEINKISKKSNFVILFLILLLYFPLFIARTIYNDIYKEETIVWKETTNIKTVRGINYSYEEYKIKTTYNLYILELNIEEKIDSCNELNDKIDDYKNAEWIHDNSCV